MRCKRNEIYLDITLGRYLAISQNYLDTCVFSTNYKWELWFGVLNKFDGKIFQKYHESRNQKICPPEFIKKIVVVDRSTLSINFYANKQNVFITLELLINLFIPPTFQYRSR